MDDLWKFLGMNIPVGVALLFMAKMFLLHVEADRKEERHRMKTAIDGCTTAVTNNTAAMEIQTREMNAQEKILAALVASLEGQSAILRTLCTSIEQHDKAVCEAIRTIGRLPAEKES